MAFNVSFYTFNKRENSTARPDVSNPAKIFPFRLKDDCGIINPVLEIYLPMSENPSQLNYAYIPDFYRFYFVNDWTFSGGVWLASLNVDVLATYKFNIGPSTQYVLRSSAEHDGNIMDDYYTGNGVVTTMYSEADAAFWPGTNFSSGSYVVGIINKATNTVGAVSYYVFTQAQFDALCVFLMGDVNWLGDITEIGPDLTKALFNPFQYIASCIWFPDTINGGTSVTSVPFGWWDAPVSAKTLTTQGHMPSLLTIDVPKHPQAASRGGYLNLAPYSSYVLDSRVWGTIPLDTAALKNLSQISMGWEVDYVTGQAEMMVKALANNYVLFRSTATFGIPIQLAQITRDYLGTAINAVNTVSGVVGSVMSGNIAGAFGGAASGIGNTIRASMPDFSTSGSNGSIVPFTKAPSISARFQSVVDEDNADLGRPLCKAKRIDTIPGYIMCSHADVSLPATAPENQRIKEYMESGFFYE